WWPVEIAHDLMKTTEGPAGMKQVSSLVHGLHAGQTAVLLRFPTSTLPSTLDVFWLPLPHAAGAAALQPAQPASTSFATTSSLPKPPVFDRTSWGADTPQCSQSYCTTTHVALHHTASASEYQSSSWAECAANVKATQVYHMVTRGWCDIGYNYLVCPHGDIFEGRGGGDDVRGAHDGYNCGSMGVAMMGYFHNPHFQVLNSAMQDAFVDLAAWKCDQQGIDPLGTSFYAGYGANQANLYGHRDVSATACPGDLAHAELPQLRVRVDQEIQGGSNTLILDNGAASYIGNWTLGTSSVDKYGADYRWASTGVAPAYALWNPNITSAGDYQISLWWPAGSNRNPQTQVGLKLNGTLFPTTVNQQLQGGQWNVLGVAPLPTGSSTTIGITNQGPVGWVVMADAVRLVRQ
ncbi:MAG: golvesin C-terminal-like domain-containing protein, partial [Planctomycetota bacterium]